MIDSTYYRRRLAGLCVRCGAPLDRNGTRCKACQEYDNKSARQTYEMVKKAGRCTRCGKRAEINRTMCAECLEKMREAVKRRRVKIQEEMKEGKL